MRLIPLLATTAATLIAACSVSHPGSAPPRPEATTLHVDASELVAVKAFVRAKYLENKPWHRRHAEDIQVLVPPLLPDHYVYSTRVVIEDIEGNWHGRVLQMGIARPGANALDVTWDHVLEGGCIKPLPVGSGCYEDLALPQASARGGAGT